MHIVEHNYNYSKNFKNLNLAWISTIFAVEEHDLEQLDHPEEIIAGGGMIFYALDDLKHSDTILGETGNQNHGKKEQVVSGTVALIKSGLNEFELVKMAVDPSFQGKGVGKAICKHALDYAIKHGAKRIWLESNRKLASALYVYSFLGFKEVPIDSTPYSRADIRMEFIV